MKADERLIDKYLKGCRRNDETCQFYIYNMFVKSMYNTALRFFNNKMIAEDIVQESFVAAFANIKKFKGECSFGSWLKRIVINRCISEIRKKKVIFEDIDGNTNVIYQDDLVDSSISDSDIHNAIKELPVSARTVINLYAFEGYKHKEIADILGITESTSKTQYKRAKQILFNKLKPAYYGVEI